jgi:hypothetical protein
VEQHIRMYLLRAINMELQQLLEVVGGFCAARGNGTKRLDLNPNTAGNSDFTWIETVLDIRAD